MKMSFLMTFLIIFMSINLDFTLGSFWHIFTVFYWCTLHGFIQSGFGSFFLFDSHLIFPVCYHFYKLFLIKITFYLRVSGNIKLSCAFKVILIIYITIRRYFIITMLSKRLLLFFCSLILFALNFKIIWQVWLFWLFKLMQIVMSDSFDSFDNSLKITIIALQINMRDKQCYRINSITWFQQRTLVWWFYC